MDNIQANAQDVGARLQALIVYWLANDPRATWQKPIDAVAMSNEKVIAADLAKNVGASCQATVFISNTSTAL